MIQERTRAATGEATRATGTVTAQPEPGTTLTPPRTRGTRPRAARGEGTPSTDERHVLERTLGAALRALRAEVGMTQKQLALRAGVSYRSLQDLEAGRRRPSAAMLKALAVGSTRRMPPVGKLEPESVFDRLWAAAGASLVVDTPGGARRRTRRLRDAAQRYAQDVEAWWVGEQAAAERAEMSFVSAMRILDRPGALDDAAALESAKALLDVTGTWLGQDRPGAWGTTRGFYDYCRSKGFPVSRRRRGAS